MINRRLVRRFLAGADPAELAPIVNADRRQRREALYYAITHCLAHGGGEMRTRLERLSTLVDIASDRVDRLLLRYACGDHEQACAGLARVVENKPHNRRAILWYHFARGNLRMRRAAPTGDLPPFVFQYWDIAPPPDVDQAMDTWADTVGRTRYHRYDDGAARAFIADAIGGEGTRAYDAAWHPAMKSDLFRLVHLHERGGLYVDADTRPVADATVKTLRTAEPTLHLNVQTQLESCGIQNNVMLTSRRHPMIERFLETCLPRIVAGERQNPLGITGPAALTRAVFDYLSANPTAKLTCLSLGETNMQLAAGFAPSYKRDARSWQRAVAEQSG